MNVTRIVFNNGFAPVRVPIQGEATTEELGTIFERTCANVEERKHTHVERVEIKSGRKVLFMQRFENAVRL